MARDNEGVRVVKSELVKTNLGWFIRATLSDGAVKVIGQPTYKDRPAVPFNSRFSAEWRFLNTSRLQTSRHGESRSGYDLSGSKDWPANLVVKKVVMTEDLDVAGGAALYEDWQD